MQRKRRIAAAVLLLVILPAVLLAPFHHHKQRYQADIQCDACAQQVPHPGHLSSQSGTDDCLICQLLGQQFVPSEEISVCLTAAIRQSDSAAIPADIISFVYHLTSPRAPPISFCFQ